MARTDEETPVAGSPGTLADHVRALAEDAKRMMTLTYEEAVAEKELAARRETLAMWQAWKELRS